MATNPFAQYAQPVAPQAQPVLTSPVDQYKDADARRADEQLNIAREAQDLRNRTTGIENQLTQLQIQDRIDKQQATQIEREALATAQANLAEDAKHQMRNVIGAAKRAKNLSHDWFATGFGANKAAEWGGTSATDVAAQLEIIGSNTAFDRLQKMREASPTGGALGAVSERELTLLQSSIASLNQAQSDEQFRLAMDQVIEAYERILTRLDPDYSSDSSGGEGLTGTTTDEGLDVGSVSDDTPSPYDPGGGLNLNTIARGLSQGTDSVVRGAAALPGMIINPVGQALYDVAGYDQRYDVGNILSSALGLERNQSELGDAVIQGTASALTGGAAARAAGTIVNQAGTTGQVLNTLGRTPLRDAAAGAGAGAGMYAGNEIGGPVGGAIGALAGGAGGYATGNALASIASPVSRQLSPIMREADRLGISMLPADVGGTGTRMATGVAGRTFGNIPMVSAAQRSTNSVAAARNSLADRMGGATDDAGAGQAVATGQREFARSSENRANELYESISVPAEANVVLNETRSALNELTTGLKSNPELSRIWTENPRLKATLDALTPKDVAAPFRERFATVSRELSDAQQSYDVLRNGVGTTPAQLNEVRTRIARLQDELTETMEGAQQPMSGGELSWEDMKRVRTIVGEMVGQPGLAADGNAISALRKFYGALSNDMEATAANTSSRALSEFRRASQYWRGREARLEDIFSQLLGPQGQRAPEKTFQQINQWAKKGGGDFSRLARTLRSLPKEQRETVQATIISRMGTAKAGRQEGVDGDVFSPAEFASQWQGMSSRAKSVLFPNKQHRSDIEAIARISESMRAAGEFQNYSNTALGANGLALIGGMFVSPLTTVAGSGSTFALGSLLSSPRFARWLAQAPNVKSEAAARKWTENLGVVAANEPIIANDIASVQQFLVDALSRSPGRLAAQEDERN